MKPGASTNNLAAHRSQILGVSATRAECLFIASQTESKAAKRAPLLLGDGCPIGQSFQRTIAR
jgi:hypothetical protein